uniref:Uncharacterized protein n=1 Tax=Anguilla anguilla TaxID=7936 RepID=A0A0E9PAW3_ANGAN
MSLTERCEVDRTSGTSLNAHKNCLGNHAGKTYTKP